MGNRFFGSKATSGLCQPLIAMMPPHTAYIETHLGGGAIMKRKSGALRNLGIDRSASVLEEFGCDYPVELVEDCGHRYLATFPFDGTELVYCDPPYVQSTRKSSRRYRYDYEDSDHEEWLLLLKELPCAEMISGYGSALYDDWLRDWGRVSLQVMNQAGVVTEKVWYNFEPDRLFWARYAGCNSTHRQIVKRKAQGAELGTSLPCDAAGGAPCGVGGDHGGGGAVKPRRR